MNSPLINGETMPEVLDRDRPLKFVSFGYKHRRPPSDALMVIDCRRMVNPHDMPRLRPLNGKDEAVQAFVRRDPKFNAITSLALTHAISGGVLAFGCIGGRHRSVAMAEMTAQRFIDAGHTLIVEHLELT